VLVLAVASCSSAEVHTGDAPTTPPISLAEPITVVVLGSSTASGIGAANPAQAWVERYATALEDVDRRNEVVNLAAPRMTTYQVLPTGSAPPPGRPAVDPARNITSALAAQPDAIVVNLPSNDAAMAIPIDEQLANLERIAAEAAAAGVPMWVTTTQPRNLDQVGRDLLVAGRDRIMERFGAHAIDVWTGLASADGTIDPAYDSGDGIHLNADGHAILAERVSAAGILQAVTAVPAVTTP
jgi:lysophospholipase L1-like esterase